MIQVHLVLIHVQLLGAHTGVQPRDNTNCIGAATIDGTESSFTAVKHHQTNLHWTIFQCPVLLLLFAQVQCAPMHDVGKGDERRFDTAVHEHFQFYERNMKSTVHDYTWHIYLLEEHNKAPLPFGPSGMSHLCRASSLQDATEFTMPDRQEYVLDVNCKRLFCRFPKIESDSMLESQRNVALAKWHRMVGPHFFPLRSADPMTTLLHYGLFSRLKAFPVSVEAVYSCMRHEEQKVDMLCMEVTVSGASGQILVEAWNRVLAEVDQELDMGNVCLQEDESGIKFMWQRYYTHSHCNSVQTSDTSAYVQAVFQPV